MSDDSFGTVRGGLPALDTLFGVDRKVAEYGQWLMQWLGAAAVHQTVLLQSGSTLVMEFWNGWLDGSEALSMDTRLRQGLDRANDAMLALQQSPGFLASHQQVSTATARMRERERDLIDTFRSSVPFATVSELDDLSRAVQELKREVRALQRATANDAPSQTPLARANRRIG